MQACAAIPAVHVGFVLVKVVARLVRFADHEWPEALTECDEVPRTRQCECHRGPPRITRLSARASSRRRFAAFGSVLECQAVVRLSGQPRIANGILKREAVLLHLFANGCHEQLEIGGTAAGSAESAGNPAGTRAAPPKERLCGSLKS
jgi:hypothetical protein